MGVGISTPASRTPVEVGAAARATMSQESRATAIVDRGASVELDLARSGLELHPITTEALS